MSSSKRSAKSTQAQTSGKSSGKQAEQTVGVGGGLLDRTTFKMYDINKEKTVYAAATEVSDGVIKAVYQRYGLQPPADDEDVADCWIFPTGLDYGQSLVRALPPAEPDIPALMVLVKLRTDTPMMNRVLAATKENLGKQNDAGTSGEHGVMLAEFKAMKKDMNAVMARNDEVIARNDELMARNDELVASNDELKAEVRGLKASNDELKAEVRGLKASNDELKAEVRGLKASNDGLKAEVRGLKASNDKLKANDYERKNELLQVQSSLKASNDHHKSHSSLAAKVATLEAEIVSRRDENGELKSHIEKVRDELTRFINMITPLLLRILVDKARKKVLKNTEFKTWRQYYHAFPNPQACQDDVQTLTSLLPDLAAFICNAKTKVRKDGNKAAHNAEEGDIWDAVERTKATRRLLERTFKYVFLTEGAKGEDEGDKVEDEDDKGEDEDDKGEAEDDEEEDEDDEGEDEDEDEDDEHHEDDEEAQEV